ncbi:hypothetical protein BKA93DRAFT_810873 [Sparassis latifolia]|uniref:Uncharacterized protein n=1 Tax=Sparassis crispa TaxID=139825 RepID=A0A401GPQ7_9APHY|nr:hypothetical protein SCP_0601990 [Sparassis crispa]GBE84221.1 hypothetical protein SCP_0601990 [Sparassis crispa]
MSSVLLNPDFREGISLPLSTFYEEIRLHQAQYSKHRLVKATHYKEQTAVAHEFLILDVFDGKHLLSLRVERRPTTKKPEGPSTTTFPHPYVRITDDRISRAPPDFKPSSFYKIVVMRCPTKPLFSLPDVCTIFHMIYESSPNYSLLSNQCYWFCAVFLWGLEKKVKVAKTKGKDYDLRGTFAKAIRVLGDEQVEKDIDEYNERLQRDREESALLERLTAKQIYFVALEQKRRSSADSTKKTLVVVNPLLETSENKRRREELAVKSMFAKVVQTAGDNRDDEKGDAVLQGLMSPLPSPKGEREIHFVASPPPSPPSSPGSLRPTLLCRWFQPGTV